VAKNNVKNLTCPLDEKESLKVHVANKIQAILLVKEKFLCLEVNFEKKII